HLQAAAARAGIPGLTWQTLRRSWATHAQAWGLGSAMIQRVLRHTSGTTSEHWYRRADVANLAAAVKDVEFGPWAASVTRPGTAPGSWPRSWSPIRSHWGRSSTGRGPTRRAGSGG